MQRSLKGDTEAEKGDEKMGKEEEQQDLTLDGVAPGVWRRAGPGLCCLSASQVSAKMAIGSVAEGVGLSGLLESEF